MSCKNCEDFQNSNQTSYFRWGKANIEIRACKEHLVEVFDALKEAQRRQSVRKQIEEKKNEIQNH